MTDISGLNGTGSGSAQPSDNSAGLIASTMGELFDGQLPSIPAIEVKEPGLDSLLTDQTNASRFALSELQKVPAFNLDVTVLEPTQVVAIRCRAQVWDVDGTLLHNSGEAIHDGLHGRLSQAVSQLVAERTDDSSLKALVASNKTIFDLESWQPYRDCGNRSELDVCQGMCNLARRQFGVEITAEELSNLSFEILNQNREEFFSKISPAHDAHQVLLGSRAANIDRCACTASSEKFVLPALEHFGLLSHFDEKHVCRATKKIGDDQYSGISVKQAMEMMGSPDPRAVVTFGDTMADIGASVEARIGTIVLILEPSEKKEAALTAFLKKLSAFDQGLNDSLSDGYRPQIFIVSSLSQVRIMGRADEMVNSMVYNPDA